MWQITEIPLQERVRGLEREFGAPEVTILYQTLAEYGKCTGSAFSSQEVPDEEIIARNVHR